MNKNLFILILLISLLLINSFVFADENGFLRGHWAEKFMDKNFINKYFSDLLCSNGDIFNPDENIKKEYFLSFLYNLVKENYPTLYSWNDMKYQDFFKMLGIISEDEISEKDILYRKDVVKVAIRTLEKLESVEIRPMENKYTDLQELTEENKRYILKASNLGIVNGYLDGTFRPNRPISQIEAIIILKRLEGELNVYKNTIPFKIISNNEKYNFKEETINIQELGNKVIISITKKFPTSGYDMNINKIVRQSKGNYNIYLNITKPNPNLMVLQVITYQTITIEIDKKNLDAGEYKFTLITVEDFLKREPKQIDM